MTALARIIGIVNARERMNTPASGLVNLPSMPKIGVPCHSECPASSLENILDVSM